ncbi:MAG TPA: glucose-1-phosphate cytidylyltransferase [Candidatus Omnitrophota bacterium]|nr:glucose-1-phosphate cytidylyltransferase [Candidatus Omnitrophota bacterium]HRZ15172.1 glucose-1-phosphate cytidylyltransferase [Candidatus Omnitrophota bacterium]
MKNDCKVVILCGGRGTRLSEETELRPKPLIEIGGRPILWHIMKTYAAYGFTDFVLCLGYKGEMIKEYFLNYEAMNNDCTITLGKKNSIEFHTDHLENGWSITLVDTGLDTMTGSRVKKIEPYIDSDCFMLTYGDGVADVNVKDLLAFHRARKKIGTVTGVHPSSRFGELIIDGGKVISFSEKPQTTNGFINGGFFIFKKRIFDYIGKGDQVYLEREPLEQLASDGQLAVYLHEGFWQCMDTRRELDLLNRLWDEGKAPWKVW